MLNMLVHGGFLKGYKTLIGIVLGVAGVVLPWAYGDISLADLLSADNLKVIGGYLAAWGIGSKLQSAIDGK